MFWAKDDFPWKQSCVLAICRLSEPVAFCSITAYAFVMVQDIKGDKDASFYAGLLVSAFALAEACTAFLWGSLSDRYGRKPIILVALAGTALSSLIFGFAKNYWVALFARVIGGGLNGNVAVMQTMVAEMVNHRPEFEPRAYALQPIMWAVGSIAGAALGGFAAQPAKYHPDWFSPDGIFAEFPYLLPNLIAVGVILLAMIQGYLFLEETNPIINQQRQLREEKRRSESVVNIPAGPEIADERTPLHHGRRDSNISKMSVQAHTAHYLAVGAASTTDPSFDLRRSSVGTIASTVALQKSISVTQVYETSAIEEDNDDHGQTESVSETVFTKGVIMWMVALWLMCYHQMAFGSLLPVYLLDDRAKPPGHLDLVGGLGKTLPEVGSLLAANSIISLVIQGIIFPSYVAALGLWWATASLVILSPFTFVFPPFISALAHEKVAFYAVMVWQSLTANMAYPVILIMLKNACPSTKCLGKVNGLAMSGCSGARTIAPPVVGYIYSAIGSAGAWWSAGLIAIVAVAELFFIPRLKTDDQEALQKANITTDEI